MDVRELNMRSKECCLCLSTFTDPYVLPCGHSIDLHCIKESKISVCPLDMIPFDESKLIKNIALKGMMEDKIILTEIYELFCIDTSTSMWYSDNLIPLIGESRFDIAKQFVKKIVTKRLAEKSSGHMIGISSFDSDFKLLVKSDNRVECLKHLDSLKPIGKNTALFDSVIECQNELMKLAHSSQLRLVILTDGGDNYSSQESKSSQNLKALAEAKLKGKSLNIYTAIYGIGGDTKAIKKMAEDLGAKFHHLQKDNVEDHVTSFMNRMSSRSQLLESVKFLVTTPQEDPNYNSEPKMIEEESQVTDNPQEQKKTAINSDQ